MTTEEVTNTTPYIDCEGVGKTFANARTGDHMVALSAVDLKVAREEIVTLLGPSGCGKSTLLGMIAGFEAPSAGRVLVDGKPVTSPGPDRGIVFQDHGLFPWLTVEQNVAYGLREKGLERAERIGVAQEYIDLVGLTGFNHRFPHELSGGMQQRVGITRVLAIEPRILLMDEPFGALDAQTRAILQRELLAIWDKTRQAVVFVTHNVEEAVFLGHRVVVMTARPGTVKTQIPVGLPIHGRDVTSEEFNDYRRQAQLAIETEVDRALESARPTPEKETTQ